MIKQTSRDTSQKKWLKASITTQTHLVWTALRSSFLGRPVPWRSWEIVSMPGPTKASFQPPACLTCAGSALCFVPHDPRVTRGHSEGLGGQIQMPASNFAPTALSVQICPENLPPLLPHLKTHYYLRTWLSSLEIHGALRSLIGLLWSSAHTRAL